MKILSEKNGFLLTVDNGFYQFGGKLDFNSFYGIPVNQLGKAL